MQRDDAALLDIAQACKLISSFVRSMTKEDFLEDFKTQSSVQYQIIIIGEAVKRLSPGIRKRHSEIPWTQITGMRDVVIHGYDIVDWDETWDTATKDVPELLAKIEPLLPTESQD